MTDAYRHSLSGDALIAHEREKRKNLEASYETEGEKVVIRREEQVKQSYGEFGPDRFYLDPQNPEGIPYSVSDHIAKALENEGVEPDEHINLTIIVEREIRTTSKEEDTRPSTHPTAE